MENAVKNVHGLDRLLSDFFSQDDLGRLAADAGEILNCPLLVIDDTFHVVAHYTTPGFSDTLFEKAIQLGEITYEAGAIISRSEALMAGTADYVKLEDSVYRRRFVPLISSGVRLGFLICVDTDGHLQKIPQETWNTVEQILAKQAFIETSRHDKPFETAEDILMHLLDGGFSSALYFSRGWMRCMTASSTSNTSTAGMARSALKLKHPRCAALRLCVTNALPQIRAVISGSTTCRTFGFFIVASRISHMLQCRIAYQNTAFFASIPAEKFAPNGGAPCRSTIFFCFA